MNEWMSAFATLKDESESKELALQSEIKNLNQINAMEKGRKMMVTQKYNSEKNKTAD